MVADGEAVYWFRPALSCSVVETQEYGLCAEYQLNAVPRLFSTSEHMGRLLRVFLENDCQNLSIINSTAIALTLGCLIRFPIQENVLLFLLG
jgi:hypothetical protein